MGGSAPAATSATPERVQQKRPDWLLLVAALCISGGAVAMVWQREVAKEKARMRPRSFLVEQQTPVEIPIRMPVAQAAPPVKSPDPEVVELQPLESVGGTLPESSAEPPEVVRDRPESERKALFKKIVSIRAAARKKAMHEATQPIRDWKLGTSVTLTKPIMFPNDPEIDGKAGYSPIFEGNAVKLHERREAAVGYEVKISIQGSTPRWIDCWIVQFGVLGIGTGLKMPDYSRLVGEYETAGLTPLMEQEQLSYEGIEALFTEGFEKDWPTGLSGELLPDTIAGSFCEPCLH